MTRERVAYVALAHTPGIGPGRFKTLMACFGSAELVLAAPVKKLRSVSLMSLAAATAIKNTSVDRGAAMMAAVESMGGAVLLPDDAEFPAMLRDIRDPPVLLFALGRLELLKGRAIAIVGSRAHSRYGAQVVRHLAGGCARAGLVVVSGMARGIDALAHEAALDAEGGTIGVLGNGLGVIYPSANRELYARMGRSGLLLTEFPPGDRPNEGSFQERNRLISGLAEATLVIEAREKSGALITVNKASEQGRETMAVPGPITSPVSVGCNRLIQDGSRAILGMRDILDSYKIGYQGVPPTHIDTNLTDAEKRVLAALSHTPRHIDVLARAIDLDAAETLAVLTSLEIRGLASQAPGKMFQAGCPLAPATR
jgi:DNA processing protein